MFVFVLIVLIYVDVNSVRYQGERKKLSESLQNGIKFLLADAFGDSNPASEIDESFDSLNNFVGIIEAALTHGLRSSM